MTAHAISASEALDELARTTSARRVEELADVAPRYGAPAIPVLLWRLGDALVQDDPDTEDAICSALCALGVMDRSGNQRFVFRPRHELPAEVVGLLRNLDTAIPLRYYVM